MSGVVMILRQNWADWAVSAYMAATAAMCRSPISAGLFSVFAATVAIVAARESWKLVQPTEIEPTHREPSGSAAR
ncbi:hypothetical protein [Streptomyces sp. NPDC002825]|uniref:hypothetical protein n=1 Tax=Streptomyces sp. NPDC002825 TaxID=3154666 RepID=UPI003328F4CB